MSLKPLYRPSGAAVRNVLRVNVSHSPAFIQFARPFSAVLQSKEIVPAVRRTNVVFARNFHDSKAHAGLMPDSADPPPKQSESSEEAIAPTYLSTTEYNKLADAYLEELHDRLERQQETRQDLEVEYSAGVMEVSIASKGIYVLNKQPPNKQIWLSSPLSGPKRFDWVVKGESANQKEGGGSGDWVYLRDGTSLTDIVRKELGVELGIDDDAPQ